MIEIGIKPHKVVVPHPIDVDLIRCWPNGAWLRIAHVKALQPGEELELVSLHRNMLDELDEYGIAERMVLPARRFLIPLRVTYIHRQGWRGTLKMRDHTIKDFGFDVNYRPCRWYPIIKGVLPAYDPQMDEQLTASGQALKWENMNEEAYIGYRGPLLKWDEVKRWPRPLYWDSN